MANTIILKKSSTANAVPAAGSLQPGELAVNLADGKLYTKTVGGTVILVGSGATGGVTISTTPPASPTAGQLWWDSTYGNLKVYYNDGTSSQWVDAYTGAVGGSGGGTPGGSSGQIQFNDAGAFAGDADLTWDNTTNSLTLGGTDTGLVLAGITNEPASAAAGTVRLYAKSIAGKLTLKTKGPSGIDFPLQNAFWQSNVVMWTPTTATAGFWLGTAGAGAGTYTTALPTTTNLYTVCKRGRWANVATTTNQVLGQRNTEAMFFRGAATEHGGFFFYARAGFDVWTNGGRFFAGMHTATTVVSADPSALNNTVGFCVDAADNGAISFLTRNTTTATKASTGFTIVSNKGYDLFIFCAPNSSQIQWRIVDLTTGTEASGTATLTLPTATTMLTAGVLASNAALTTATAIQLGVAKIYVETDY